MSEDQPKQPPVDPTPQKPTPIPTSSQSGTTLDKVTQTAQQSWVKIQPVLKVQSIKALKSTIQLLEGVVEKLEAEPITQLPPTTPPAVIVVVEPAEVAEVQIPEIAVPVDTLVTAVPAKPSFLEQFRQGWLRFIVFWNAALQKIRSFLPESLSQKLSNTALSGVVAGVLLIVLWTTSVLLPGKPSPASDVAVAPPPADIETPAELEAPSLPQPVETAPPPPPELTPEQSLITSIQKQVGEVTSQYADGLIQSIQADFPGSRLAIQIGNGWYELNPAKQDKLADEILRRSQELNFSQLEIKDSQGTLLARSPVVGTNVVILKRRTLAESELFPKPEA